jgi:hypothetical protein
VRGGTFEVSLCCPERFGYRSQNAIRVRHHLVVPKPQDEETCFTERLSPPAVLRRSLRMLAAIEFHYELRLMAEKISDKAADRNLPPKFEPVKLPVPDKRPQLPLSVRFLAPEFPG